MPQLDTTTVLQRIDQLIEATAPGTDQDDSYELLQEVSQSALTLYTLLYGPNSVQAAELLKMAEHTRKRSSTRNVKVAYSMEMRPVLRGALRALRHDVESGLVGQITLRAAGEMLGDMLGLAKEAMRKNDKNRKNVAAVLVAATYEDTIRRMGDNLAGVTGRPDLQQILTALKSAGVLQGSSVSIGQSYLKFRNDALHADWEHVDKSTITSCMAWLEGMLEKHFS